MYYSLKLGGGGGGGGGGEAAPCIVLIAVNYWDHRFKYFYLFPHCPAVEGIDQTSPNCDCTPTDNFWAEFSSLFAKAANGVSFFLGNGQRSDEKGAYSLSSFFATIEIPSMNAKVVDKVVTIVVHQKGKGGSSIPDSLGL